MVRKILWLYVGTALLGTAWHFLYPWVPIPLVGLIAPVNESVWEHLKLLFWPFLFASPWIAAMAPRKQQGWGGCLAALLFMPVLLLGVYYPGVAGFGIRTKAFPVVLYYAVLAAGFFLAYRLRSSTAIGDWAGTLLMGVGFYCACLVVFSLAAPPLQIFQG